VNEIARLKIRHGGRYLGRHVEEHGRVQVRGRSIAEVIQEVALTHKLSQDIERRLTGADTWLKRANKNILI